MRRCSVWLYVLILSVAGASHAELQVHDDLGQLVAMKQPAQRIVSLAPSVTEMLFAVGAGDRLVGVVNYSDYPAAAQKLPVIGSYNRLDFEQILALQPDLVVGWNSGNGAQQLDRLREFGLRVYATEPRYLNDIATNLERLGVLAGGAVGEQAAGRFRAELQELSQQYADKPKVRLFYQIWDHPLMTINGDHLISKVISVCGGTNVFADLAPLAGQILPETVLAQNPEAIVGGGMDGSRVEWFDLWKTLPEIHAVQKGHLFVIHPDLIQRHTPRVLQGARQLCGYLEQVRQSRS